MRNPKIIQLFIVIAFLLGACGGTPGTSSPTAVAKEPEDWWREAIFYEIFVRSFYDTNGDGIGDFRGITQKMDYLQKLGIPAIWLMPIQPSPSYHGYDVTDYFAVNPDYGTMDDFKELLKEAHQREIRIIIDLVLNHTSSQHPWFLDANSNPQSKYRDFFVWSPESNGNGWHAGLGGYYFGYFCDCMPDLNYRNPEVATEMFKVTDYWLNDIGVDGFRVDAAKHLIEEGEVRENTPATHDWLKGFYTTYKAQNPQAYTVGEVFGAGASVVKSYTGNQLDQIFNFEMSSGFVNSARGGANSGITSAIKFALMDMPDFNFATFLTNHDQDRSMSVFNGEIGKAKVAATLLLTSPGTPFIYYGEEIGMTGQKPDEDIRLPMQWSSEGNAGFTTGTPWREPAGNYKLVNVAQEDGDPKSLLTFYRRLIQLRREYPALRYGDITLLETDNPAIFAAIRRTAENNILILVNLKGTTIADYQLRLAENNLPNGSIKPSLLLGAGNPNKLKISDGGFSEYRPLDELPPYGSFIFLLER
jgi:glycosidase